MQYNYFTSECKETVGYKRRYARLSIYKLII